VLKDVERILRSTFPKSIQCRFRIDPSLAPISGDVTQIHQVLLNLCVNARDAMPEGGTLSVVADNRELDSECRRINRDAKPGSYVRMEVSDTGHGIPPDILDKIFDPFFTTKDYGKGTGLGLSTALTIVKNHGGFLNVYSIPGHGASFSVYVPSAGPGRTTTLSLPEAEQVRGSNELILVVDDEEFVRDVALETLESAGYRVLLALDGVDGLRTFLERKSEIDAVLTDVMMPNMDGLELVKRIRSEHQNIPIVAMSGMVASEKLNEMKTYGVRELLLKPFTSRGLAKSIHEALSGKSGIS
jgi:CheY-like chemotaxis protein